MEEINSPEEILVKIREVVAEFFKNMETAKKEHRDQIRAIIKDIEERKIKELKEKLSK